MLSWSKSDDRVAIAQMNAELRNAQLELLSAECATDRLRLRYTAEDVARFGQRELVRKAVASATALHEYYANIARQLGEASSMTAVPIALPEEKIATATALLGQYLKAQRELYRPLASDLSESQYKTMESFFPGGMLAGIRIVQLENERVSEPAFYTEAKALGLTGLPEISHMASMTFDDVVVFPGHVSDRRLFHALVHAVQFKVLGMARYCDLFVRSFLRTRNHVSVPLEMHAFTLEVRFADAPEEAFSVEEMVRLWANQGRY